MTARYAEEVRDASPRGPQAKATPTTPAVPEFHRWSTPDAALAPIAKAAGCDPPGFVVRGEIMHIAPLPPPTRAHIAALYPVPSPAPVAPAPPPCKAATRVGQGVAQLGSSVPVPDTAWSSSNPPPPPVANAAWAVNVWPGAHDLPAGSPQYVDLLAAPNPNMARRGAVGSIITPVAGTRRHALHGYVEWLD